MLHKKLHCYPFLLNVFKYGTSPLPDVLPFEINNENDLLLI